MLVLLYAQNKGMKMSNMEQFEEAQAQLTQEPVAAIVKNAILANSHPAEDWYLAFNDAEEIDIVVNQIVSALPSQYGDPYQGAREDLAIWKKRALESEEKLRKISSDDVIERLFDLFEKEHWNLEKAKSILQIK